jgi:flagellar basal-body rod modification protein FlgD
MTNTLGDNPNDRFSAISSKYQSGQTATRQRNDEVGKNEFMQLLITQLKNQDPEAPLDSKEFAVQLAQFTQVEKLISIDQKLTAQQSSISSLAGYLGQQVNLAGNQVSVKDGAAGQLQLNLPRDASSVTLQLLGKSGEVIKESSLGGLKAGKQMVDLKQLGVPDGVYGVRVSAVSSVNGTAFAPEVQLSGRVTGFVPGANPKLIVNGREVAVSDVKEVTLPPQSDETSQA